MNTKLWLFAVPALMAASVANAAIGTAEDVYFTSSGTSYFNTNNWQVNWVDGTSSTYAGTGYASVAAFTGYNWVGSSRLEASPVTFSYAGEGTGFLLNSLVLAGYSGSQTLTIIGYNGSTEVSSSTAYVTTDAQQFNLGWTTAITSFEIVLGDDYTGSVPANQNWGLGTLNITAVPEPESFAMLLAGLAVVGAVARRRRSMHA
ncbi:MAG: PEP-CTERM sorting domain-containing protein [Azoarcus sp.]|jgi:hypothetical protein|nr:PEP-CTERM sorting domain-containing protein [Azoarcus sp.]